MSEFFKKLLNLDRRIIFIVIALSTTVPLFFTVEQKIVPDDAAKSFYNTIKKLKVKADRGEDVVVLFSAEYGPGTVPELSPMAKAAFKQLLDIKAKIIIMGLYYMGPPLVMAEFNKLIKLPKYSDRKYGVDYVNLGYTAGNAIVIKGMVKSIISKYPIDVNGTSLNDIPLMRNVKNFDDIDLIVDLASMGGGSKSWIQFAKKTTDEQLNILSGCTAVIAPESYPYLNSGQLKGLLGGLKGAADYEKLIETPGNGTKYMFAQSIAHVMIMLFILIGNFAFFITRKKRV